MSEENTEVVDSEISTDVDTSTTVKTEQPSSDTIEYWKAEALKNKAIAERKAKQLEAVQKVTTEEKPEAKPEVQPSNSNLEGEIAAIKFKMNHPELDVEDMQSIIKISRANGCSLDEALNDPLIKNNLEYKKVQSQNNDATLTNSTSSHSSSANLSEVEKLNSLSGAEREKAVRQKLREMGLK